MATWSDRASNSTFQELVCRDCTKKFPAWRFSWRCDPCEEKVLKNPRQVPSVNMSGFASKRHSLETIDGKGFYHDEWIRKKEYEKYVEYEEKEKKPMLDAAAKAFRHNNSMKENV